MSRSISVKLADCLPVLMNEISETLVGGFWRQSWLAIAECLPVACALHQMNLYFTLNTRDASAYYGLLLPCNYEAKELLQGIVRQTLKADSHVPELQWRALMALSFLWNEPPWQSRIHELELALPFSTDLSITQIQQQGLLQIQPFVQVSPLIESDDASLWTQWCDEVLPVMLGYPADQILIDALMAHQGRAGEHISCLSMGRYEELNQRKIKLSLGEFDLNALFDYLESCCPSLSSNLRRAHYRWLRPCADRFTLHLSLPMGSVPQFTISCRLDEQQETVERWNFLLQALEARGLCQPDKRTALEQCRFVKRAGEYMQCWPQEALQLQQLMGRESQIVSQLDSVHLDFNGEHLFAARAQVKLKHEWGMPWRSLYSGQC